MTRVDEFEVGGMASDAMDADASETVSAAIGEESPGAVSKFRLSRGGPAMERLEEEYARVVKLMDAMREHMASQTQRGERMVDCLERLAGSLADAPATARAQTELLTSINELIGADAAAMKRVEASLSQIPTLADAQRETMVLIGRQLEVSSEASERVAGTMDDVQHAIAKLGESTDASTKAVEKFRWDTAARDEKLGSLIQEQTRKMAGFAWSAIALATIAAVIALVGLLR